MTDKAPPPITIKEQVETWSTDKLLNYVYAPNSREYELAIREELRSRIRAETAKNSGEVVAWRYERNGKVRIGEERSEEMTGWTETPLYSAIATPTNSRAEQAKQYELIGYVALEDIQNKPDYFDVATKWNGHNKVPVYALATSANSRAEAIGAARGWIANNMYEGDANAVAIVNALSALLQREGE